MTTALVLLREWMESQVEFWMPVQDFAGYDVSNFGRVRSYWIKRHRRGVIGAEPHIMCSQISVKHADVALSRNGRATRRYIYRLVAKAFIPNPNNWPEVNHITAYPADNRKDGLEWQTHKGNHKHAAANGLHARGSRNGQAKLTEEQVLEIKRRLQAGEKQVDIAQIFDLTQGHISQIKSCRNWRYLE